MPLPLDVADPHTSDTGAAAEWPLVTGGPKREGVSGVGVSGFESQGRSDLASTGRSLRPSPELTPRLRSSFLFVQGQVRR